MSTQIKSEQSRVSVERAAKILGLSALSVQCGLKSGVLPIGCAWKNDDSTCFTYHISPKLLSDYTGISVKEIMEVRELMNNKCNKKAGK